MADVWRMDWGRGKRQGGLRKSRKKSIARVQEGDNKGLDLGREINQQDLLMDCSRDSQGGHLLGPLHSGPSHLSQSRDPIQQCPH